MDQVPTEKVARVRRRGRRRRLAADEPARSRAGQRRASAQALRRAGSAADRGAGRDGVQRHPARRAVPAEARRRDGRSSSRRIEKEIHALAGHEFNIASLKQLREVLFEELKLPVQKRDGHDQRAEHRPGDAREARRARATPLPRKIIEHRQITKLKGTYVDALPALVNPNTGRVHTSFNQTVAATGRLSSTRPEPAEHPGPAETGPADPPGVPARGRAGRS